MATKNHHVFVAVFVYLMIPAFLSTLNAPFLLMVLIALVERVKAYVFPVSGTKIRFFCKFAFCRRFPVGLNWVARTRFEYPPALLLDLPVIAHSFAIVFS